MSFLTHILRLNVSEENEGTFLVWRCPKCEVERDFNLVVSQGSFSLLGLRLGKAETLLDLRCAKCRYEMRVAFAERELLDQAGQATCLLKSGELAPKDYDARVREIPARFVKDLLALTETWKCKRCGEANPMGFDTCWNCSSRGRPEMIIPDGTGTPYPGIPRGGNPWE